MPFEIKELTELVEEERTAEENIKKVQEEAKKIKEDAEKKAREIIQKAESGEFLEGLEKKSLQKIKQNKKVIENKYKKKIEDLEISIQKDINKFASKVVEDVLSVKT